MKVCVRACTCWQEREGRGRENGLMPAMPREETHACLQPACSYASTHASACAMSLRRVISKCRGDRRSAHALTCPCAHTDVETNGRDLLAWPRGNTQSDRSNSSSLSRSLPRARALPLPVSRHARPHHAAMHPYPVSLSWKTSRPLLTLTHASGLRLPACRWRKPLPPPPALPLARTAE